MVIDPSYAEVMRKLAGVLCDRADSLQQVLPETVHDQDGFTEGNELHDRGKQALENNTLYSSASFCFGAGLQFSIFTIAITKPYR